MQTPAPSTLGRYGRLQRRIWDGLNRLKEGDLRYSLKVGVPIAILAAPAFIDATRPIFVDWRGEWALISVSETVSTLDSGLLKYYQFFVVMGQTIGAVSQGYILSPPD
jgi:hypothetical protein